MASGLAVPVGVAAIASLPKDYEDRVRDLRISGLRNLRVAVPERHDLAMMKIARGDAHDLASLEEMHSREAFDLEILVGRYRETLPARFGPEFDLRLKFLAAVARLFGADAARRIETRIKDAT